MQPNQYPQNPFQYPAAQPAAPQGQYPPAGIAPQGAGAPLPAPAYGQPAPYGAPAAQYGAPMPGPAHFGDPFANVGRVPLTRGEKLYLRAPDLVLAELTCAKVHNGPKGLNVIFELRVLWSERGLNRPGTEPSVVLRKNFYFDAEVTTWMCALLGIQEGRDQGVIEHLSQTNQWSQLCHLATSSPDGRSNGPGPFAGTVVLLDCYQKIKQDKFGTKVLDAQGREQYTDLARPEAVAQVVGDALRYLRSVPNPDQDPQAQQHIATVRAAMERRLPVPAYDPNALAARVQAARQALPAAPAPAPAQPAPNYGQPTGYGQPQPGYGAPAQPPPGYPWQPGYTAPVS